MTKTGTRTPTRETQLNHASLPIIYHQVLDDQFAAWAEATGWKASRLRSATEVAIRTRHHEAVFQEDWHRARKRQPDIHRLTLGRSRPVYMYYTIEPTAVVVRGYAWELNSRPGNDDDCGGIYTEYDW